MESTSTATTPALEKVSDDELLRRLGDLVSHSRRAEADLIAHIGEVDRRQLYAREASPSMFVYCRERLHLSEAEAYMRIRVGRAARRYPMLLDMLRDGRLHLSGIVRLLKVLTVQNRDALLARATHASKRQILELVAELSPRPDIPNRIRKLPGPVRMPLASHRLVIGEGMAHTDPPTLPIRPPMVASASQLCPDTVAASPATEPLEQAAPGRAQEPTATRRAVVEPLSPGRYKVQFTASAELRDKLERLQTLMRFQLPEGDLSDVIEAAVSEKLERLEAARFGKVSAPRKSLADTDMAAVSRHVPAAVRRAVHERDGNRCAFTDAQGRRCTQRDRLEFHHRRPFGMGGDYQPRNLALVCRAHNQLMARIDYGVLATQQRRKTKPEASSA